MNIMDKRPFTSTTTTDMEKSAAVAVSVDSKYNYIDYANAPMHGSESFHVQVSKLQNLKNFRSRESKTIPFPLKLHEMLDRIERDGLSHVVSWQPHGRCFVVHDQDKFVEVIMPTYFKQTKFASFQRQLNLYGFNRLTSGPDKNGYYNELFLRGRKSLSLRILRLKIKGTGVRKPSSPETEPAFYCMPPIPSEEQEKERLSHMASLSIHRPRQVPGLSPLDTNDGRRQQQAVNRMIANEGFVKNQRLGLPTVLSQLQHITMQQQQQQKQQQQQYDLDSHLQAALKRSAALCNIQSTAQPAVPAVSPFVRPSAITEWLKSWSEPHSMSSTPSAMTTFQRRRVESSKEDNVDSDDESEQEFDRMLQTLGELPTESILPTSITVNPLADDSTMAYLFDI